jgi:DNA-binding HxlR family transcriptional regulator
MGAGYHQFCPVTKAMELLDERWTLLVIRELVVGSRHFNDLRRGVPRMSPSLLSTRLRQLERAGVITRQVEGREVRYLLTDAGRELREVVEAVGRWGTRWIGELGDEDLDPQLLLWDMHRNIDHSSVPGGRTVIHFHFTGPAIGIRDWWLIVTPENADVCDADPGYPVAVTLTTPLRTMTEIWRGDRSWSQALSDGTLKVESSSPRRPSVSKWFKLSDFARVPRPA